MQMLHFRVPTSCNGMRLNIFLRTMGVSSACIKAVKYQGTGFCVRLGDEVIPVHTDYRVANSADCFVRSASWSLHRCSAGAAAY